MKVSVKLENGYLPDKYAKLAEVKEAGNPVISFPFEVSDLPKDTKYLAWSLVDYDSIPVCGFAWIHWVVSDVPVTNKISEDFSRMSDVPQGFNSTVSKLLNEPVKVHTGYIGPTPPDKDHDYTLNVYALNNKLGLKAPYYYNQFLKALDDKVLSSVSLNVPARA